MLRLATDPHYFANPCKSLFNDIRVVFPMTAQQRVYRVVDRYLAVPRVALAQPATGYTSSATARVPRDDPQGRPCQRMPLPHNGYCPSHQHLSEPRGARASLAAA